MADSTTTTPTSPPVMEAVPPSAEVTAAPQPRPQRPRGPPLHQIYALPAPIRTFPLPSFYPSNPLSLFHLVYAWAKQVLSPPPVEPSIHTGIWDPDTRSVHITDPVAVRAFWEQGFYGKGNLSRSEPNWLKREQIRRGAAQGDVSEQRTALRREERRQVKWERARVEQEALERTRREEAGLAAPLAEPASLSTQAEVEHPAEESETLSTTTVVEIAPQPPVVKLEPLAAPEEAITSQLAPEETVVDGLLEVTDTVVEETTVAPSTDDKDPDASLTRVEEPETLEEAIVDSPIGVTEALIEDSAAPSVHGHDLGASLNGIQTESHTYDSPPVELDTPASPAADHVAEITALAVSQVVSSLPPVIPSSPPTFKAPVGPLELLALPNSAAEVSLPLTTSVPEAIIVNHETHVVWKTKAPVGPLELLALPNSEAELQLASKLVPILDHVTLEEIIAVTEVIEAPRDTAPVVSTPALESSTSTVPLSKSPVGPLELLALPNSLADIADAHAKLSRLNGVAISGTEPDTALMTPNGGSKTHSLSKSPVGPLELLALPNSLAAVRASVRIPAPTQVEPINGSHDTADAHDEGEGHDDGSQAVSGINEEEEHEKREGGSQADGHAINGHTNGPIFGDIMTRLVKTEAPVSKHAVPEGAEEQPPKRLRNDLNDATSTTGEPKEHASGEEVSHANGHAINGHGNGSIFGDIITRAVKSGAPVSKHGVPEGAEEQLPKRIRNDPLDTAVSMVDEKEQEHGRGEKGPRANGHALDGHDTIFGDIVTGAVMPDVVLSKHAAPEGVEEQPPKRRRKSVRFSEKVESATFLHCDPPNPERSAAKRNGIVIQLDAITIPKMAIDIQEEASVTQDKPKQATSVAERLSKTPSQPDVATDVSEIENKEHLQLSTEEAFFLSYGIGALSILDKDTNKPIPREQLLSLFRSHSYFPPAEKLRPNDPFLVHHAVYHHFRSLGWVPRHGIKFGVDWMLYTRGPVFDHAEFGLIVMPSYSHPQWTELGQEAPRKSWHALHGVNRVLSHVLKSLVLVYVDVPPPAIFDAAMAKGGISAVLKEYKVREFMVRRWSSNRNR